MKYLLVVCLAVLACGGLWSLARAEESKPSMTRWEYLVASRYSREPDEHNSGLIEVLKKNAAKKGEIFLSNWAELSKLGAEGWDVAAAWLIEGGGAINATPGQDPTGSVPMRWFLLRRPLK
jgi:hypothetical protein